jgi:hypothetical protein
MHAATHRVRCGHLHTIALQGRHGRDSRGTALLSAPRLLMRKTTSAVLRCTYRANTTHAVTTRPTGHGPARAAATKFLGCTYDTLTL